jgi:peptide deformylase
MAVLPITKYNDPLLREKSRELTVDELKKPETQQLIDDMIDTMWAVDGIGLAAVQVHKLIRLAIITQDQKAIVIINPTVIKTSFKKESLGQGCLSVPGYHGTVKRPRSITIHALDRDGNTINLTGEGLVSHIIQHEIDHMNGILFIDKAKNLEPGHPDDIKE